MASTTLPTQTKTVSTKPAASPALALTTEQHQAATSLAKVLLLVAIAGSGKTTVLVERMIHFLKQGTLPEHLLMITYSRMAAESLRTRVGKKVSHEIAKKLTCVTFHALGSLICREEAALLGLPAHRFTILDERDSQQLMAPLAKQVGLNSTDALARVDQLRMQSGPMTADEKQLLQAWRGLLKERGALDFTELLLQPMTLFKHNPAVLQKWQRRFPVIMVDEYQDVSPLEERFLKLLITPTTHLTVVGDDDQSLYGFRHANKALLTFEQNFPTAVRLMLTENFRSKPDILTAATRVIRHNAERFDKQPKARQQGASPVHVATTRQYGYAVAQWVRTQPTQAVAILARTNRVLDEVRPYLQKAGLGHVQLVTIHGSKGLEWDSVAIIGVDQGVLPHRLADDLEEERRLLYVGMTRAKHHLMLFFNPDAPSPFLKELDSRTRFWQRWFQAPPSDIRYQTEE